MTASVLTIYTAMSVEYGVPYYFQDSPPPAPSWSHMGWYNRRKIAGSGTWSQHSWANAIDIGPLPTVAAQQPYYDFLTTYGEVPTVPPLTEKEENVVRDLLAALEANGGGTQTNRQLLLDKTFRNTHPVGDDGEGLSRGDTVVLT